MPSVLPSHNQTVSIEYKAMEEVFWYTFVLLCFSEKKKEKKNMRERGKDGYEALLFNTQNTEKDTKNIWNLLFPYTFRKNKHCPLQVVLLLQTDPKSLVRSHFLQSNLEQKMVPLFHIWKTRVLVRKTSKVWKDQTYSINKNFIAPLPIYTWSFCLT